MNVSSKLSDEQKKVIELVSSSLGEREFDLALQKILSEHSGPFSVSGRSNIRISDQDISYSPWLAINERLSKFHLSSKPMELDGEIVQDIDPDVMDEIVEGLKRILEALWASAAASPGEPCARRSLSPILEI